MDITNFLGIAAVLIPIAQRVFKVKERFSKLHKSVSDTRISPLEKYNKEILAAKDWMKLTCTSPSNTPYLIIVNEHTNAASNFLGKIRDEANKIKTYPVYAITFIESLCYLFIVTSLVYWAGDLLGIQSVIDNSSFILRVLWGFASLGNGLWGLFAMVFSLVVLLPLFLIYSVQEKSNTYYKLVNNLGAELMKNRIIRAIELSRLCHDCKNYTQQSRSVDLPSSPIQ